MSTPLHWQADVGAAQYEANMSLLEWAQRSRARRLEEQGAVRAAEDEQEAQEGTSDDGPMPGV